MFDNNIDTTVSWYWHCDDLRNSYNTGKSALPDIYARRPRALRARGRVRIRISGKARVPVL